MWNNPNNQRNPDQKSIAGDIIVYGFKLYYSDIVTKSRMVMAQKQTHRPIAWNTGPRNKPTQEQSSHSQQKCQNIG
jgi:hypothetical protein